MDDFIEDVKQDCKDFGVSLYEASRPQLVDTNGRTFNWDGDCIGWAIRKKVAEWDPNAPRRTGCLVLAGRGMSETAHALVNAKNEDQVAAVFSQAFIQGRTGGRGFSEWFGPTFMLMHETQIKMWDTYQVYYHHASSDVLPTTAIEYFTPPPKNERELARMVAVDAALSFVGFQLVRAREVENVLYLP